ncbi:rhomboid family intramembrane serine protease [Halorientalis marina]|uniref:rhomboid family intramembrane serine protease n=1 Tax=Halorientalis marina TaxID=2931976 RepID=UPI001FF2E3D6|nr:rhomboid family intramembrane serine protease [Halorientalis marina]
MNVEVGDVTPRRVAKVVLSNFPVTVLVFTGIAWWLADSGIYFDPARFDATVLLNPLNYFLSMFLHADWSHFAGNIRMWLVFGTILTVFTSNRHVLLVAVASHLLTHVVGVFMFRFGIGMSIVVFAVIAAALVRATGYAFQNASLDSLQAALAGVLAPLLGVLFVVVLVAGGGRIGHFDHFLGFLFGGAIEMVYVFSSHEGMQTERSVPERIGR